MSALPALGMSLEGIYITWVSGEFFAVHLQEHFEHVPVGIGVTTKRLSLNSRGSLNLLSSWRTGTQKKQC